jgi:conjugation transfer TcpE-like protein
MGERLMIRSYRRVFEVDRRIYRVDRWALPVPGGVPLRGVAYFVAALALVVVAGRMPGLGELVEAVSAPLRYVVGPLAVAVLATQATPDGRAAHRFARSWLGVRWRARRRSDGRRVPREGEPVAWSGRLAVRWDAHTARLIRGVARGPARVVFARPVRLSHRGGRLVAREVDDAATRRAAASGRAVTRAGGGRAAATPHAIVLCDRQVLELRP